MSHINIQTLIDALQIAGRTPELIGKLVVHSATDATTLVTNISGQSFVTYRWGSMRFYYEVKFNSSTARNKIRAYAPQEQQLAGIGPISAHNMDFLYHYITDFSSISSLEKIKERLASPWLCGMYSTAIALTRYVKENNLTHPQVKVILRGSKWRWIKMPNGDYIQQTLFTSRHPFNDELRINPLSQLAYYHHGDATSILDLTPFPEWVTNVYDEIQEGITEEDEQEAARDATRLFSHSDRAEQFFEFKKGNKPAYTTYMGVELELENHNVKELPTLHTVKHHCIFKRDGSLNNGVELCSAPATLDLHLEAFKIFFDAHTANKSNLKAMASCGMHVHVDKAKLSRLHIANIGLFMNLAENDQAINKIAGREENRYCVRENQTYYNFVINRHSNRYTRINFTNERTIEFRLFASTTNYTDFAKRMEFTQAVIDYTRPGETSLSCKDIPKWNNFVNYTMSHRKHYPTFVKECL